MTSIDEDDLEALELVHRVIAQFAPDEQPLVDDLYRDFVTDPALFDAEIATPQREHSLGEVANIVLFTSLVIPVAVGVISHLVTKGIDEVIDALRKRAGNNLSDEDIVRLAKAIIKESQDLE